jgi:hypothetical protein
MSETRFVLDLSFLSLLMSRQKTAENLTKHIQTVLESIIYRNFKPCTLDDHHYIFSPNKEDMMIKLSTASKVSQDSNESPYLSNLESRIDAFDDSERYDLRLQIAKKADNSKRSQTVNPTKKKTNSGLAAGIQMTDHVIQSNLNYDSCKKLLLSYDLVIKGENGDVKLKEPIKDIKNLFNSAESNKQVDNVTQGLS